MSSLPPHSNSTFSGPPSQTIHGATRVGRYELLMELASGGMATVFIGRQRGAGGFERLVAIKRMHPHIGAIPELAASFMDEARIASLIHHPNVVSVHDVHETDGERLLVMDYIDGASLTALIKGARKMDRRLPVPVAIHIIAQALRGLHAAHEQKSLTGIPLDIVHRDATPQNILIGIDGSVRLTDFGIAKASERSAQTTAGNIKGKFRYMAPEQAMGRSLDRRVDIFALGAVLWEMLSGQRFLKGDTDIEIIHNLALGQFEDLHQVAPTISPDLSTLVMSAVASSPDSRWATAEQFADALEYWARSTGNIATATDVAALLQELCGSTIEARRKSLSEILTGQRPPVSVGTSGTSTDLATGSNSSIAALSNVGSTILPTPEPTPIHPLRQRAAIIGGVAFLLFLVAYIGFRSSSSSSEVAAASTPSTSVSALPTQEPPPKVERIAVSFSSDRTITEIKANDAEEIQFREDGVSFTLPKGSSPITVTLHFRDQTTSEETLTPSENVSRRLVSPESAKTSDKSKSKTESAKPTGKTTETSPTKPSSTLKSNPFNTIKSNPFDN